MAITFHPAPRTVLMCDFQTGFRPPEMTKVRPVVVISPKRNNRQTCIVVPLSTVEPRRDQRFHHKLDRASLPRCLRDRTSWVKANMLGTVALWRLDRVWDGRDANGKQVFVTHAVTAEDWEAILCAVNSAFEWQPCFKL
jgi:mRNA interferase MazF